MDVELGTKSVAKMTQTTRQSFESGSASHPIAGTSTALDPASTVKRGIESRHSQMVALAGGVGTGLFVGTSAYLAVGGPAFLLVSFIILTALVYFIVTAVVEITAYLPVPGASMSYYATRMVSKSLGFSLGWLYWYSWGILVPYEMTAGSLIIEYWDT